MLPTYEAPVLLTLLLGPLLGFLAWGFWRSRHDEAASHFLGLRDDVLLASLLLAVLAIGAFFIYLLLATDA